MLEVYQIEALKDNYIYVLKSGDSVAVVDPGEAVPVSSFLKEMEWGIDKFLLTHHHPDHTGGVESLKSAHGGKIVGFEDDFERLPGLSEWVREGSKVRLGYDEAEVIEIPGHTVGHVAYYFKEDGLLFCGDTLFSLGCGRLFEGTAEQMWTSLLKLRALPDETQVFCAHEYTQDNGEYAIRVEPENAALVARCQEVDELRAQDLPTVPSSLGLEKATNPFLRADEPSVMQRLEAGTPLECFTKLRKFKDQF